MLSKKIGMLFTFLDSALLPQLLNGLYEEGGDEISRELKPCPFCGGNARVMEDERFKKKSHDFPKWAILCMGCGIRTPIAEMAYVVKIWNRRATT